MQLSWSMNSFLCCLKMKRCKWSISRTSSNAWKIRQEAGRIIISPNNHRKPKTTRTDALWSGSNSLIIRTFNRSTFNKESVRVKVRHVVSKRWAVVQNDRTNFIHTPYCVCYTLSLNIYFAHVYIQRGSFLCTCRSETFLLLFVYFHIFVSDWLKVYLIKQQQPHYRTLRCVRCVAVLVIASNSFTTVWKSVAFKTEEKQTVDECTNTTP